MPLAGSEAAGPKVAVVQIIFEHRRGHFVPYALATEHAVRDAGAEFVAVTDRECPAAPGTSHWRRVLPPPQGPSARKLFWRLRSGTEFVWRLNAELLALSRRSRRVVIYLDWFTIEKLLTVDFALIVFRLLNVLRATMRPPTELLLWIHRHETRGGRLEAMLTRVMRFFAIPTTITVFSSSLRDKCLAAYPQPQVKVVQIAPPVNETISEIIETECLDELRARTKRENGELVCLLAGQVFSHKGYDILEQFLSEAGGRGGGKGRIVLRAPQGLRLRSGAGIEIEEFPSGHLSERDYVSAYLSSDVVLMPFASDRYESSASGVFTDAVTLGCVPVVSRNTTMASELGRFGLGELVMDWNEDFSWDLVASMARDESLREKLRTLSGTYRRRHLPALRAATIGGIIGSRPSLRE